MADDLRSAILNADDLESEVLPVPQWGVEVLCKTMTGLDRAAIQRRFKEGTEFSLDDWYVDMILAGVYHLDGKSKVFEPADREALKLKSNAALELVATKVSDLSGMGVKAVEEAKEELGETTT